MARLVKLASKVAGGKASAMASITSESRVMVGLEDGGV